MSITTKCRECGRRYSLKEEMAGKKFRCKECQAPVTVPVPVEVVEDPWDAEDFGDYEDYEDHASPPPPRPKKRKKPAAKKKRPKRRSSSSSEIGPLLGKIAGGAFGCLVVLGFILRLLNAGGLDLGGSWDSYTTPDGNITVQMPGKVKSVPVRDMVPGGKSFGAERRGFGCIVIIEPMPAEMKNLSEAEMYEAMEVGLRFLGASNVQSSQINGRRCVTFEKGPVKDINISGMAFVYKNRVYTLHYAYKGSKGTGEQKYFSSIQFN